MSLILDALNKADNERNTDDTPSLSSDHDGQVERRAPELNPKVIYGLIAALILLVCVVIALMLGGKGNSTANPASVDTAIPTNNMEDSQSPSSLQANVPTQPQPNQQTSTDPAEPNRYSEMKEKLIAKQYDEAAKTASEEPKSTATIADKKVASIYQKSAETTTKAKQKKKAPPKPTPAPKLPSLADYPSLDFIGDMPYAKQKAIPTLMYNDHSYSKDNATVILNKITRRQGQQISDQLFLEAIVEDGIVLKYQGLRFKIGAYNSWINM
ncbi:MAG: general secretion pathway protein GspB [Agarilytica sp.]